MNKIRNGHIGYNEALAIIAVNLLAKGTLHLPADITREGHGAGWLILLVGLGVALITYMPLAWLLKKFPRQNIMRITEGVMGKYLGTVFNIIYFMLFFGLAAYGTREFVELVKTTVLPLTPISVVLTMFILTCIYAAYQGIEPLARGNWLYTPFFAIAMLAVIVGVTPFMQSSAIFPVFGPGIIPVAKFGLLRSTVFTDILIIGIIAPFVRDSKKVPKIGFLGLIISGLVMIVLIIAFYMADMEEGAKITFPVYHMAQLIFYGRFLQRLEVIFVFVWVTMATVRIASLLYCSVIVMSETLKLPNYRPLLFPVALLTLTVGLLPMNLPQVLELLKYTYLYISSVSGVVLPLIVFLVALIFKRGPLPEGSGGNN